MTNLFVGGLPYSISDQELMDMFKKFGEVSKVQVIIDRDTRQSKGFGFVEMPNEDEAKNAIQELDGKTIDNRPIAVSVARQREQRTFGAAGGRSRKFNAGRGNGRR